MSNILDRLTSLEGVKGVWISVGGRKKSKILLSLDDRVKEQLEQVVNYCQEIVKGEKIVLGCKTEYDFFLINVFSSDTYVVVWAGETIDSAILKMEIDIILEEFFENNKSLFKKFKFW
ncbi:hypothetical protein SAMN04488516_101224 [Desulfonauticus submarinus]|uniref:Roadblock/LAMTOR2 domain-containing protein n=1 Tax=Desulfonauticus submarinus TaxID=206665 RepID=A0A1G9ZZH0_9BACT|nr:hypothetical protein [Desulfonauticus submarinus]SDN26565.1 hypothetical protein SAMN04488516_101224 [Desulfonauticus submarinus]